MGRLSQDEIGAIRALGRRGVGSREIARLLNVDESTVRYHLRRAEGESADRRKNKPEVCGRFAGFISEWLEAERARAAEDGSDRPPNLKALYSDLVTHKGFAGSYKSVVRYVRRRTPAPRMRPHRRVEVQPGTQCHWPPVKGHSRSPIRASC